MRAANTNLHLGGNQAAAFDRPPVSGKMGRMADADDVDTIATVTKTYRTIYIAISERNEEK